MHSNRDKYLPGCGKYVYQEGGSDKFYIVTPAVASEPYGNYTVTWGRNGTRGQSQTVPREEAARRIREKVNKGYKMVADMWADQPDLAKGRVTAKRADRVEEKRLQTQFIEELFKIS